MRNTTFPITGCCERGCRHCGRSYGCPCRPRSRPVCGGNPAPHSPTPGRSPPKLSGRTALGVRVSARHQIPPRHTRSEARGWKATRSGTPSAAQECRCALASLTRLEKTSAIYLQMRSSSPPTLARQRCSGSVENGATLGPLLRVLFQRIPDGLLERHAPPFRPRRFPRGFIELGVGSREVRLPQRILFGRVLVAYPFTQRFGRPEQPRRTFGFSFCHSDARQPFQALRGDYLVTQLFA